MRSQRYDIQIGGVPTFVSARQQLENYPTAEACWTLETN